MYKGILDLSLWGYIGYALLFTHVTVMGVTLYLHRSQAHRAVDFHPVICHFFRFWVWLTTAMGTRVWVAIHRKHHSFVDTKDDPHSPVVLGLPRVFFGGVGLYRKEADNLETIERFGRGTPNDWLERKLYAAPFVRNLGLISMLIIDCILFGVVPGTIIWAVQMIWIPLLAAGVINGIGHYWGYRNFESPDASRNVIPLGLIAGGEELHNNHHAFATSAKLSVKWWEFDIGWFYIKLFEILGLAKVLRSVPELREDMSKQMIDHDTLSAFLSHRLQVMDQYCRKVMFPVLSDSKQRATDKTKGMYAQAKKLLVRDLNMISDEQKAELKNLLAVDAALKTIYDYYAKLQEIWTKNGLSQAELLERLKAWCHQAEATGIKALQDFAAHVCTYTNRLEAAPATA